MASISCYSPRLLRFQLQNERLSISTFRWNKKRMFQALANASNASPGKRSSGDDIVMVDPLEAKRLAEKQMIQIKAKEKFKRRRQAEAINGALAMIGLTAGLVVEGQTGKGILGQASPGKRSSGDDIVMVDPLEAKRLAEKQMIQIKAKEKFKRRRQAEAINGALAMIGLTAGLVVEGQTGKGILGQLAGYLAAFVGIFMK